MGSEGKYPFLLTTAAPNRHQRQLAAWVILVLLGALLVAAPFAQIRLERTEILLPAYAAAVLLVELLTAALLLALFSIHNSRPVLTLAIGYLFSGLLVIPWALTFPGVFTNLGLDTTIQATATIAAVRRLSFPLFILAYALTKDRDGPDRSPRSIAPMVAGRVALVAAVVAGLTVLVAAQADALPVFMRDARDVTPLWRYVPATAIGLYLVGLAALWSRGRSTLDLWLMVVLCTLLIEIILLSYLSGGTRLSVGWWAGRFYGLASAGIVLLVLLSESATLQARLARSVRSERLARESRLTAMEALSASVAHEINQPLASMVTNASAGLRWLERDDPRIREARAALERVVRDGHRARDVVDSIRTLFKKGAQERVPLDLNQVIESVLQRSSEEVRLARVAVEAQLDPKLPLVTGNPLQLQQVISNLVANAVDAMSSVADRLRIVRITSGVQERGEILVSVEDTGRGIDPNLRDRIFEPFFSTKPEGMGMGLMFSRSIIESHGGRLWAASNRPHGAILRFTLPAAAEPSPTDAETVR
jgi:signal transduction histidine kinase